LLALRTITTEIVKSANRLAVRLTAAVVNELALKPGDEIELQISTVRADRVMSAQDRQRAIEALRRRQRPFLRD